MMGFHRILALCLLGCGGLCAQARNDYHWILGHNTFQNNPAAHIGGISIDFNRDTFSAEYFLTQCATTHTAVLSSDAGRLLAYTNGCRIYNGAHEVMERGDTIAYGHIWDSYCDISYPGTQHHLFLPWPGDSTRAVLFYFKIDDSFLTHYFMYATVRFDEDHPLGIVESKDQVLLEPGTTALITATRHGNGRDWWVVIPEDNTNRFFSILLHDNGVEVIDTQTIGTAWGPREWAGQAAFSPDGTRYVRFNPWKGLDLFDFDRCTGILSNPVESGPFTDPVLVGGGVAFSFDSRFLYVSNVLNLYQYDLQEADILASRRLIDTFDGYSDPFPNNFYQMALAPDGKIYVFSTNDKRALHVIHRPTRPGTACDFRQHSIEQLPAFITIGGPNLAFFRLGPAIGSSCDTLGIRPGPVADFRYEPDPDDAGRMHFMDLSYFAPETWYWDFGNGWTSDAKDPLSVLYGQHGQYNVCLTVTNPYGTDTFCRQIQLADTTTRTEVPSEEIACVFPNPFATRIRITTDASYGPVSFSLYSLLGSEIYRGYLPEPEGELTIPEVAPGLYIYRISAEGKHIHSGRLTKIE